jgi:tetratricopeptide (TPR) repeat protein
MFMHDAPASGPDDPQRGKGDEAAAQWLDEWLSEASPALNKLIRYAALPHTIDPDVLSTVSGVPDATAALAELARAGMVTACDGGRYRMRSDLRRLLIAGWLRTDVAGYRAAHAQFAAHLAQRPISDLVAYVELAYHQLGGDDRQGLAGLASAFEACLEAGRVGLAERLLGYAREHQALLSPATEAWLRYYEVGLGLARGAVGAGEAPLRALLESELAPELEARVHLRLGEVLVATQRWNEAFSHFEAAQKFFARLGDEWQAARAAEAHGLALINLAASLGGPTEALLLAPVPRYRRLLGGLLYAPFLLYRWFSRRIAFLPNLYFGTNYQTWIIVRLIYRALDRFKEALRHAERLKATGQAPSTTMQVDLQIRIADLQHRAGEWARANKLFRRLDQTVAHAEDDYRWATLRLAEGRAQVAMGQAAAARSFLEEAREVFLQYEDRSSLAHVDALLGNVAQAAGDINGAVNHYVESATAALEMDDLLAATSIMALIETLRTRSTRDEHRDQTPEPTSQEERLDTRLTRRAYITRFSGGLLSLFRWAAFIMAPLTLVLIIKVYSPLVTFLAEPVEAFFQAGPATAADLLSWIVGAVVVLALAVWLYELLYLIIGWLIVRRLRLPLIEQYQPEVIITAPEGIAVRDRAGKVAELAWGEVSQWLSMDFAVWRTPIALFSRQVLVGIGGRLTLNGTTSDYAALGRDIKRRLAHRSS